MTCSGLEFRRFMVGICVRMFIKNYLLAICKIVESIQYVFFSILNTI